MRSDEKPLRVESSSPGWFRAWANRSYPEGIGCYCASARTDDSGGPEEIRGQPKERRRKAGQSERPDREEHEAPARLVKNFQRMAALKMTPLNCEQNAT